MLLVVAVTGVLVESAALAQPYSISHLAGSIGGAGFANGSGTAARFDQPWGVAVDTAGYAYVTDTGNSTIRKVTPAGVVTTFAGLPGAVGSLDGVGTRALISQPTGIAVDASGNLFVTNTYAIRKITPAAVVTTLAGGWDVGSSDGPGRSAKFLNPRAVAVDNSGNLYVADTDNSTIRRVAPDGFVTTIAGLAGSPGSVDGAGTAARFMRPSGLAVDESGTIYVADTGSHVIRTISPEGVVTTLAGLSGSDGFADGARGSARFNLPSGVTLDGSGNILVTDMGNRVIRRVSKAGVVTTLAGRPGILGTVDGPAGSAEFISLIGIAVGASGSVYAVDAYANTLRRISPEGNVSTIAGLAAEASSSDGVGSAARFWSPAGVALEHSGDLYVADVGNGTIRRVTPDGVVTTFAGLAGSPGGSDGLGSEARFDQPHGVALDSSGNLYVADAGNSTIRKITPAGAVTTFAGMAYDEGSPDGAAGVARFRRPRGVAVDGQGNVYVADTANHTIRKITAAGAVTTLAGLAGAPWGGVGSIDGIGDTARFTYPVGVTVDDSGNLYVAEYYNRSIRSITPAGVVTTRVGRVWICSTTGFEDCLTTFGVPSGIALADSGDVYVADWLGAISKMNSAGIVTDLAGGLVGSSDGIGSAARFSMPAGVAVGPAGEIYISDSGNNAIRKGIPAGLLFLQGRLTATLEWKNPYTGTSGVALAAQPQDGFGYFYFTDPGNPEVFVKALDFGSGRALVFVGGMTDFYYKVTIRSVFYSQPLVFEKPAGSYAGFADAKSLSISGGSSATDQDVTPEDVEADAALLSHRSGETLRGASPAHRGGPNVTRAPAVLELTLSADRVQVAVEWRRPNGGAWEAAFADPQRDTFGFFHFSDPGNPEVVVKVLDFGEGRAVCFVGGLTSFSFRVTFKVVSTGQTLVFEKPASVYTGFADNGTLKF